MSSHSKLNIIRSCFASYKAKDRKLVEDLLTDDFRFTNPYDDAVDKATYFERCWPNSERIRTHILERLFEQGSEAFVTYKCMTARICASASCNAILMLPIALEHCKRWKNRKPKGRYSQASYT